MASCQRRPIFTDDRKKLKEKLKRDKTALEKRIAEQTKEFESDRRLTERRLKMWMDPKKCEAFDRRLKKLTKREARALERRVSCKLNSIIDERRYLQSRTVFGNAGNIKDCIKHNNGKLRDLLIDLQCDPDSGSSKKKQRQNKTTIVCGVG